MVGGVLAETGMHTAALVQEVIVEQKNQVSWVTVVAMAQGEGTFFFAPSQ